MLTDARSKRFDIVLAEALDRLSRRLADTASLYDELEFLRIRLVTKSHGEITKMHTAMMGMVAEQFIADLREKTRPAWADTRGNDRWRAWLWLYRR